MFVDVSNNAQSYADTQGVNILKNQWNAASDNFNTYMLGGNASGAFNELYNACNSFNNVAGHISNPKLAAFFRKTYSEFKALLDEGNLVNINNYMIKAYPQFKANLGCR